MSSSFSFAHEFIKRLEQQSPYATSRWQTSELPSYQVGGSGGDGGATSSPDGDLLVSQSTPQSFVLGTGASIFTNTLIPAIASAQSEVIFVTCFWAPSTTLTAIHDALTSLANHRRRLVSDARSRGAPAIPALRVRICLSSRSLFQKLLHPQSRQGYVYPPSTWPKQLGLPDPALLKAAAIDLHVKSLFFLPFSVMHPKFVIIDRQRAFVPSCNVSWESWLEGCVELTGPAIVGLMSFYSRTWERDLDFRAPLYHQGLELPSLDAQDAGFPKVHSATHHRVTVSSASAPSPTLILPSSYHWNPHFHPFPWQESPRTPGTPLNVALLELLDRAQRTIYIQTPNLTCEPAIAALLDALQRGVDVTIVTSRNMMLLEQLVTAGTTTSWCIRSLVRRFRLLKGGVATSRKPLLTGDRRRSPVDDDLEAGRPPLGHLCISYFQARPGSKMGGNEGQHLMTAEPHGEEPVHSHLKLTIVDGQYTVLGSQNMDRASWYTSQELGILFHDESFAVAVKAGVDTALDGRLNQIFDSGESRN
ncbi:hypothetical protein B0H63DRAFT_487468 [Podospora didyma]|uniref:PLD phosphodiesterase domain-containing protein n=1 Tax=Podospora didyma TaxID=330526 RepID=A0AAE0K6S4_9PEZI|nr:hypothetical protein B0H63DRAFT_487468 [Podospora didyma]